jgi:hypothetical protein
MATATAPATIKPKVQPTTAQVRRMAQARKAATFARQKKLQKQALAQKKLAKKRKRPAATQPAPPVTSAPITR